MIGGKRRGRGGGGCEGGVREREEFKKVGGRKVREVSEGKEG